MKKYLLGATLPLLAMAVIPAYANYVTPYQGAYIGGAMGGAFVIANPGLHTTSSYTNIQQLGNFQTVINEQSVIKGNVFRGDVYAGSGLIWQEHYYLGAELSLGVEHFKESNVVNVNGSTSFNDIFYYTSNTTTAQIKPFHVSIDFRPGFVLAPTTLLYGRIGVSFVTIDMHSITTFVGGDPSIAESFRQNVPQLAQSHYKAALRLGLGLEQHITNELSLRADYVYTNYGRLSAKGTARELTLLSGDTVNASQQTATRIVDNAIMVGLSYFFC